MKGKRKNTIRIIAFFSLSSIFYSRLPLGLILHIVIMWSKRSWWLQVQWGFIDGPFVNSSTRRPSTRRQYYNRCQHSNLSFDHLGSWRVGTFYITVDELTVNELACNLCCRQVGPVDKLGSMSWYLLACQRVDHVDNLTRRWKGLSMKHHRTVTLSEVLFFKLTSRQMGEGDGEKKVLLCYVSSLVSYGFMPWKLFRYDLEDSDDKIRMFAVWIHSLTDGRRW